MISSGNDDKWPTDEDRTVPDEYLIAFGQVTLAYNLLEGMIEQIFERCAPLDPEDSKKLFHSLNNRERTDLLSAFAKRNEKDEAICEAIQHCVLCYDICTANRNVLIHVVALDVSKTTAIWTKRASHNSNRINEFQTPLTELRLVADQIAESFRYAWGVHLIMWYRAQPAENDPLQFRRTLSLPDKPPKPRTLTPYQQEV
jgi:hypothetical protein